MGVLSFLDFVFVRKPIETELEEEYFPTGEEIAEKYNKHYEPVQLNPGSWLAYIGDNK
jgi:hypothetical protein